MAKAKTKAKANPGSSASSVETSPLRLEWRSPAELAENPANWRRHPERQIAALTDVIAEVGWAGACLYNEATGRLIDGHARKKVAMDQGASQVPVLIGSWTEEQERKILATLDPLAAMAESNKDALDELLRGAQTGSEALAGMLTDFAESEGLYLSRDDGTEPEPEEPFAGVLSLWPDVVFPSSNEWGLPDLREDMLGDQIPEVTYDGRPPADSTKTLFVHGTAKFGDYAKGGTLCFYVDDERFESIWNDAVATVAKFLKFGWGAVVSPDFSVWRDQPLAAQLWNIYRSRWCARYWQEAGVRAIPSLNWSDSRSFPWVFAGYPERLSVAGCQCRTTNTGKARKLFLRGLCQGIERTNPGSLLIYGGSEHRQWVEPSLPRGVNYVWLDSWAQARRKGKTMGTPEKKEEVLEGRGGGGGGQTGTGPRVGGTRIGP